MRTRVEGFTRRVLDGKQQFVVSYSPEHRTQKRASSMHESHVAVVQRFDPQRFNFTRVAPGEKMFWVSPTHGALHVHLTTPPTQAHPVLVNISPLAECHMVLPFFCEACMPQVLELEPLKLMLCTSRSSGSPRFKVMFNSLGANASQNHLHGHGLYAPSAVLPIERALRQPLLRSGTVSVSSLKGYPTSGFCFEAPSQGEHTEALAEAVMRVVEYLQRKDVAHNLLVCDAGTTVMLIPRQNEAASQASAVKMAVAEVCGMIMAASEQQFEELREEDVVCEMGATVALDQAKFAEIAAFVQFGEKD